MASALRSQRRAGMRKSFSTRWPALGALCQQSTDENPSETSLAGHQSPRQEEAGRCSSGTLTHSIAGLLNYLQH